MKKVFSLIFSAVMLMTLLAACTPKNPTASVSQSDSASESETKEEGYLNLFWEYLNDTQSAFPNTLKVCNTVENKLIWDTVLRYDEAAAKYIGVLAKSWKISEDGMSCTVVLKDNAYFHDGVKVTAKDVVFSYNFQVLGTGGEAAKYSSIVGYDDVAAGKATSMSGITAVDDYTITFQFKKPNYACEYFLASAAGSVLPYHILGEMPTADAAVYQAYWEKPIGSGPYKVAEVSYPNYCTIVRNDEYHGDKAGIKNIMLTYYDSTESAYAATMSGDVDMLYAVSSDAAPTILAQNTSCKTFLHESCYSRRLFFNVSGKDAAGNPYKDLQNEKVRQALNLIIDKEAITARAGAVATLATTLNNGQYYNSDIPVWKRDVAKGVEMLKSAGFDFNHTLTLYTHYTDQMSIDVLDIIVSNLAEAGIKSKYFIDGENWNKIKFVDVSFDICYGGGGGGVISPYSDLVGGGLADIWFSPDLLAYIKATYAPLYNGYSSTPDPVKKQETLNELQVVFMKDMYMIPLWFRNTLWVINTDHLQGFDGYSGDNVTIADLGVQNWSLVG